MGREGAALVGEAEEGTDMPARREGESDRSLMLVRGPFQGPQPLSGHYGDCSAMAEGPEMESEVPALVVVVEKRSART
jgi:hypothetical protein